MGARVIFYLSALREGMKIWPKPEETEGNLDSLAERDQKKCLTNASVRGKLNEFAPEGTNQLEKEPKQAVRG